MRSLFRRMTFRALRFWTIIGRCFGRSTARVILGGLLLVRWLC